jgi:hydrogenase nickel incorporation protein HypA/HybF
MHEFSLAAEVIKLAGIEAEKNKALAVTEITIEVGNFSGIEVDAFEAALGLLAEDSVLGNALLNIVRTKGKGICNECGMEFEMDHRMDTCPRCKSYPSEIKGGTEFRVVSLVIEQDE